MNLETSQTVFVGRYLSREARDRFRDDYNFFNNGLMKLPIDLPGFAFRNTRLAIDGLVTTLTAWATQSRSRMAEGDEPSCLIDFWMQELVKEIAQFQTPPRHSSDAEIGSYLFDFLFGAQDASTLSLLWVVTLLDSHPEVLQKVREEVSRLWSPESNQLISTDQLREMRYTQAVAREVVRYRASATLVPHIATVDFLLTNSYTIPKGTILFPYLYDSSFQGFTEPNRFDPELFLKERQKKVVYNAIEIKL